MRNSVFYLFWCIIIKPIIQGSPFLTSRQRQVDTSISKLRLMTRQQRDKIHFLEIHTKKNWYVSNVRHHNLCSLFSMLCASLQSSVRRSISTSTIKTMIFFATSFNCWCIMYRDWLKLSMCIREILITQWCVYRMWTLMSYSAIEFH